MTRDVPPMKNIKRIIKEELSRATKVAERKILNRIKGRSVFKGRAVDRITGVRKVGHKGRKPV